MELKKDYKKFVENYLPFEWEIDKSDRYRGQHSFEIGFKRFFYVFKFLKRLQTVNPNPKIIDVGSYPGNMIKLCQHIFRTYPKYLSVGLDLDDHFVSEVKNYNVECLDTEIDPNFPASKETKEWNVDNFDVCLLLDTIEHLVNPTFCLDKINKSLKVGGHILLTTDNISNFLYVIKMILKGESPNVNFILSSMFYIGNHRPHHREFSKKELEFLLKHSGFEVIEHEYFDREQGEFFVENKKLKKRKDLRFKALLVNSIKNFANLIPHFRNHQIILAKKTQNINDIQRMEPTSSKSKWMQYRLKKLGY